MAQTKIQSLVEQLFNVGSGFCISFLIWDWVVIPVVERGYFQLDDTLYITGLFTITSITRSYVWRRIFNWYNHRKDLT